MLELNTTEIETENAPIEVNRSRALKHIEHFGQKQLRSHTPAGTFSYVSHTHNLSLAKNIRQKRIFICGLEHLSKTYF